MATHAVGSPSMEMTAAHCDIWLAAIAAVPLTITAVTALVIALRAHAVVKTIVNGAPPKNGA